MSSPLRRLIPTVATVAALSTAGPSRLAAAPVASIPDEPTGTIAVAIASEHLVEFYSPSGERTGSTPTGISPRSLAQRDNQLFVANRGSDRAPGSDLSVIDLQRRQTIRTIQACAACAPRGLAFGPDGTLWISAQKDQAVYWMSPPYRDPAGSAIVAWGWPQEIAAVEGQPLLVAGMRNNTAVAVIDARTAGTPRTSRIEIGPVPDHVIARPGTSEIWVSVNPLGQLAVLTAQTDGFGAAEKFRSVDYPTDLAFTPDGRLVCVSAAGVTIDFAVFDAQARTRLATLDLDGLAQDLSISPDGRFAAVTVETTDGRHALAIVALGDGKNPKLVRTITLSGQAGGVLWIP